MLSASPAAWEAIAVVGGASVTALGTVAVAALQFIQRRTLRRGTEAAEKARENTAKIANGFAEHTTLTLDEVADMALQARELAVENRKTLVDISHEVGANRRALDWITEVLTRHVVQNDRGTPPPPRTGDDDGTKVPG